MKASLFLGLLYFSIVPIFGQKVRKLYKLPENVYGIITHKEKYYFMSTDSTYETVDAKNWKIYPNKIPTRLNAFYHYGTDSCTYVYFGSGGDYYKFDGERYTPLNQEGDFKNQFGSAPFIYQNQNYLFGGYGLFTYKNVITYFNLKTKNWEKLDYHTNYQDLPHPRSDAFAQVYQDNLYIGLGKHYFTKSDTEYSTILLNDFWKFNFKTKTWDKLGEMIEPRNPHLSRIPYKDNITLMFDYMRFYGYNILKNQLIEFPERTRDRHRENYIVYNAYTDRFLAIKYNRGLMDSVKIYTPEQFLGKKQIIRKLYKPINEDRNTFIASGIVLVFFGGIAFYYFRKKQRKIPVYRQIQSNLSKIEQMLEKEEWRIFNQIYDNYPNKIPYLELLQHIDQKLSYDSQKKKLKTNLDEIDNKIQELLDMDESVFIYSKNESDKRMKEVKIK